MKILFCHTGDVRPEVENALAAHASWACRIDTSANPTDYWHAIRTHWDGSEALLLIEQDVEINSEVVESFRACDHDWCMFAYAGPFDGMLLGDSLGCTRFSAEMQRAVPHDVIAGDRMLWYMIDGRMSQALRMRGYDCVVHGIVKHHHDYDNDPRWTGYEANPDKGVARFMQKSGEWLNWQERPDLMKLRQQCESSPRT